MRSHWLGIRIDGWRLAALATVTAGLGAATAAEVEYGYVPPLGATNDLEGQVSGVSYSNHHLAVYIYVGAWYTKPTFAAPATAIDTNGTWVCDITTGGADTSATRIASFLLPTNDAPPLVNGAAYLPASLYSNAVAFNKTFRPQFWFSGYEWGVKDSGDSQWGPGPNYFSPSSSNVFVDAEGRLHLRITERDGKWYCAEIISRRNFGHGTYRVYLDSALDGFNENAVLGLFTWDDDPAYTNREIDVEISQWGDAGDTNNAQFVVQPWLAPNHRMRYRVPPTDTNSTYQFTWRAGAVDFASFRGRYDLPPESNDLILSWTFAETNPPVAEPGAQHFRFNLWLTGGSPPSDSNDIEMVVSRFVFVPDPVPPPAIEDAWSATGGAFRLQASAEPQLVYDIWASTNLADWQKIDSVVASSNVVDAADTNAPLHGERFYRLTVPPQR